VTKEQVGLGNVDNTADMGKPVSTAQAKAIADACEEIQNEIIRLQEKDLATGGALSSFNASVKNLETAVTSVNELASQADSFARNAIQKSRMGVPDGVATLDGECKVYPSQTRSTMKLITDTSYAVKPEDEGYFLRLYNTDGDCVITLPSDGVNDLPVGSEIEFCRYSNKATTIKAPSDKYLFYPDCPTSAKGGSLKIGHLYGCVALKKITNQTWIASGDIE
jgi:hypothetical protein